MSEGRDEKLTASQLELGLKEARGKEAEERQRIGDVGVDGKGDSPLLPNLIFWRGFISSFRAGGGRRWGRRCTDVGVNWAVICGLGGGAKV